MKATYVLSLLLILITIGASAQVKKGDNVKNASLGRFEGTYVWSQGTDTVTIYLRKENIEIMKDIRSDVLIGFHKYVKNGHIIESSYEYRKTNYAEKHSTILILNRNESNTLEGILKDLTKKKSLNIELEYSPASKSMTMKVSNREGVSIGMKQSGFTLPQHITLKRQ